MLKLPGDRKTSTPASCKDYEHPKKLLLRVTSTKKGTKTDNFPQPTGVNDRSSKLLQRERSESKKTSPKQGSSTDHRPLFPNAWGGGEDQEFTVFSYLRYLRFSFERYSCMKCVPIGTKCKMLKQVLEAPS
jgi:hypothetical protein